jgi:magnesium chelatase subunit I
LIKKAVKKVFGKHFRSEDFASFLQNFTSGRSLEVSDTMPTVVYGQKVRGMGGIHEALQRLEMLESPAMMASALEFILEGLHLNKKLNKKVLEGEISYWG